MPDVYKPPREPSDDKPLDTSCGGESLITSSAGAVFERFIDTEEDACGLDFTADETADADEKNDGKKRKCRAGDSEKSVKEKAKKL